MNRINKIYALILFMATPLFLLPCYGKDSVEIKEAFIEEKPIVIITASYNNAKWYKKNLDSVFRQDYENYHVIYIDDCSTDNTFNLVKSFVQEKEMESKVTLIHNDLRVGAMANQYNAIHTCDDKTIIIIFDGDDFLATDNALRIVNDAYQDSNVWMTYGQLAEWPQNHGGCRELPQSWAHKNSYREEVAWPHFPSQLRTFYAGLFKKIKKEDLFYNGEFFPMMADLAVMFPLLEMARDHAKFISTLLMYYNMKNPLNDMKRDLDLQHRCEFEIRKRPKYEKVESPF